MDALTKGLVGLDAARAPRAQTPRSAAADAATEFEAMMLGTMVNDMMKDTMPKTMNGGMGEEMFRSVLGNEIGRIMAETGGIGLAERIRASMEKSGGVE
ncbi:rod-binding protein [Paracoccus sp. ME4]|uniref:rod-binding protein n=1 Tax=Paracoccus sp. ME4 TaxID=3138066 RepID=UPI00398ACF3E